MSLLSHAQDLERERIAPDPGMSRGECLALEAAMSLYRSDSDRARHDQQSCRAPAMSEEERAMECAQEKIRGDNK